MKKILNKAFASVMLSSSLIVPMTSPIMANEVEIQITNADEFVNYLLSVETISDGQITYTPFKVVDDSNYLSIINSETTYNKLTGLDSNSVINQQMIDDIDAILLKNTEKTYQTFLAEAKALQQAKEQAAKEQAAKEQAAKEQEAQNQVIQENTAQESTENKEQVLPDQVSPSDDTKKDESTDTNPSQDQTNQEKDTSKEDSNTEDTTKQEEQKQEDTSSEKEQVILNTETKVFTGSANGIRVSVYAPSGTFEEGTEMRVVPLSNQEALEDAQTALGKQVDQAVSVDISFWKDGIEVEPNGHVSVQFSSDAFGSGSEVSVIHDAGNGQVSAMKTSTSNDLTITTDSFSPYTLATVKTIETQVLSSPKVVNELVQNTTVDSSNDANLLANTSVEENLQTKAYQALSEIQADSEDSNAKALAFIQTYLTSSTGVVYSQATSINAQNILNSKSAWEQLSKDTKIAVNTNLMKKVKKTYNKLYLEAQSFSSQTILTGTSTSLVSYSVMLGTSLLGVISVLKKKEQD